MRSAVSILKDTSAFGLIETLMVGALTVLILAATFPLMQVFTRDEPRLMTHGARIQEARAALERVTRDLRQSYVVNGSSSTKLDVSTYGRVPGVTVADQRQVVIDCGGGTCTRQSGAANGALAASQRIITGVTNADIFTFLPDNVNPRYVQIKFTFDIKGDTGDQALPITLSQGVQLRNAYNPS